MEESKRNLISALDMYGHSDYYPFHMPGHKRNPDFMAMPPVYRTDITEIDGFDNLHHARGILLKAQERAARVRGSRRAWFLVNGSTCGILAAIFACTRPGGKILVARNGHKAVYNAIELRELNPVYLYPKIHEGCGIYKAVDPDQVKALLEKYPGIQAVVITSPTYEGVMSDIGAIAQVVHDFHIPLIVDSAHGAHFGYEEHFLPSPVSLGADVVVESLHKTLPSMTQTALLHQCSDRVSSRLLEKYLAMFETSSPSYVMMAAMDQCMALVEERKDELFKVFYQRLESFYQDCENLKQIRLMNGADLCTVPGSSFDRSKLVLWVRKAPGLGPWLYDRLREDFHLQFEMASADYALAMTSICDTAQGFDRLKAALKALDQELDQAGFSAPAVKVRDGKTDGRERADVPSTGSRPPLMVRESFVGPETPVISSAAAALCPAAPRLLKDAVGYLSGAYLYIYPPGIPLLVPGEQITQDILALICRYEQAGLTVLGLEEDTGEEPAILCLETAAQKQRQISERRGQTMGKLFCVMGKSASGKDSLFKRLAGDKELGLKTVVPYTTRPVRQGETDGVEYHFTNEEGFLALKNAGKIIEDRAYHTVHGLWRYFTADDGQIDLSQGNYIVIGTLEAYRQMLDYFGKSIMRPVYVEVEDGERLARALCRERSQTEPKYAEMCRRFLADQEDFSEDKIRDCYIVKRYANIELEQCFREIKNDILKEIEKR